MAKRTGPDMKETKTAEQHEMNSKYLNWYIHPLRKWGFNEKAIKTNDRYFFHLSPVTLHCSPCRQDPDPGLSCQSSRSNKICYGSYSNSTRLMFALIVFVCLSVCMEMPDLLGPAMPAAS